MKPGKRFKKIYALLLCFILISQLTACGSAERSYEETTESTAAYDSAMAPVEEAAMEAPIADESYKAVPERNNFV